MENQNYEILGVGTPLLDHLLQVDRQYLDQIPGEKYGMETIEYAEMTALISSSGSVPKQAAGGSCANTIKGLAAFGRKCALTGKVGTDANGEKVKDGLLQAGIVPLLSYTSTPTAHVTCLITPDGKRTCRAFLGAACEMKPEDLNPAYFENTTLVHIEGYTLLYPHITKRAMELAKEAKALVSFDLGSFEIVQTHKNLIEELLRDYVDCVFANEDETYAFTGKDPEKGCKILQETSSVAVVMMEKEGCWAADKHGQARCPAYPVKPLDTTGAGDLFAAGFLHGLLSKKNIKECAKWGAITARSVVQVLGAEIPKKNWGHIKQLVASSLNH